MSEKVLTDLEDRLIRALASCTFLPGSAPKRFARDMLYMADHGGRRLSDRQKVYLSDMVYRYRRQIDPLIVDQASALKEMVQIAKVA